MSHENQRYETGLKNLQEIDKEAGVKVIESLKNVSPDLGRYIIESIKNGIIFAYIPATINFD